MIEILIREWVLNSGDKEDALKFLGQIEKVTPERIKKSCEDLRDYIESDSCSLPVRNKEVAGLQGEESSEVFQAENFTDGDYGDSGLPELD